ncbi:hypothetical protein FQA39_LY05002 [Lamprigera yunnana]|nr:hypothetical protein FQA39_LY05002 [Lamprigera yunnana]
MWEYSPTAVNILNQSRVNSIPQRSTLRDFHTSRIMYATVTIKAPSFPESVSDGDLRWKKKAGDTVTANEEIGEIETDKIALPVIAPSAGVIKELLVKDGSAVQSEFPLCTLETK